MANRFRVSGERFFDRIPIEGIVHQAHSSDGSRKMCEEGGAKASQRRLAQMKSHELLRQFLGPISIRHREYRLSQLQLLDHRRQSA